MPIIIGLLIVLMLTGYSINHYNQHAVFARDATRLTRAITARVTEVRSLMTSLFGVHHSSFEFGQEEMLALAEQFHEQAPYITALGRFDRVSNESRADYELGMSELGLYNFRINELDIEGMTSPGTQEAIYYPLSMLEPMAPDNLRLVGADLNSVPGLASQLQESVATNTSLLVTLPLAWPLSDQLFYLRPAYLGKHAPTTAEERLRHFDSGYLIAVDLASVINDLAELASGFDISVAVDSGAGTRSTIARMSGADSGLWLSSLYTADEITFRHQVGNTALIILIKRELGYTPAAMAGQLVAVIILLFIAWMLATLLGSRRRNLAERSHAREVLFEEREKAEMTLNAIDEAVFTLDARHRVSHLNIAAARLLGGRAESAIGMPFDELLPLSTADEVQSLFDIASALVELPANEHYEFDLKPVDGNESTVFRLSLSKTSHSHRRSGSYILVLRDISREAKFTRELEYQASHDALTGCTNRHYFERRLAELIADLPRSDRQHGLCYMDLDQFKIVNDTCGHQAGDRLLCELTENLRSSIRRGDVLSRLGGDEFGLIIVDASEPAALAIAEKMIAFFQSYVFRHEDKAFAVRASIGFVTIDADCGSIGDVLSAADIACYAAKDSGRNSLYVYSGTDVNMAERSKELNWLPRLQEALQENQFCLHVQPLAVIGGGLQHGAITHFEFLLRLSDPSGVEITPWQFIKAAERYDLMREIDRWVIQNAIATVAAMTEVSMIDCTWSINLSGQSAADPSLIDFILAQFEKYSVDPSRIWFELTETAAISQFSTAVDLIKRIRAIGSKVALDDFGSGLSSFGYLKNLPVDVLKIDGQFVRDLAHNPIDREMVRAINQVGQAMGIVTVAEFVESQEIMDELIKIGVDYAQGYHVGRPCPVSDVMALLAPRRAA